MSHYGVIGTPTAVSHLPSISATLIENETYEDQDLQLRPTLSNQASTSSYPSPPRSATLIELTNRIKEEETSHVRLYDSFFFFLSFLLSGILSHYSPPIIPTLIAMMASRASLYPSTTCRHDDYLAFSTSHALFPTWEFDDAAM